MAQVRLVWTKFHIQLECPELAGKRLGEGAYLGDAARAGTTDDIDRYLRAGADIDANVGGVTALIAAIQAGRYINVEFLLNAGANPRSRDMRGRLPVDLAHSRKDARMVALLEAYER